MLINEFPVSFSVTFGLTMPSPTGYSVATVIQRDTPQLQERATMQARSIFKRLCWE